MKKIQHLLLFSACLFIHLGSYGATLSNTHCVVHASPHTVSSCGGVPISLSTTDTVTGSAISFNGSSFQYVSIPNSSYLTSYSSELTISAWVYLPSPSTNQKVVSFLTNALNNGFVLGVQNGGVYPELKDVNGASFSFGNVGTIPVNTWTQIGFTYKANDSMRVYVNGVVVAAQAAGANPASNTGGMTFGIASWDHQSFRTTGKVDDVRMYSIALTPAVVAATYNQSISGATPGLIGYWPLDEGSGTVVNDATTNTSGTLVSSPTWVTPSTIPLIYPVTYQWTPTTGLSSTTSASPTATVSSSTTYYVTATDSTSGCSARDSVVVSIGSSSTPVTVTATATTICMGDIDTITASGFASITWSPGGQTSNRITVSPTSLTPYIATGTDSGGCQHSDTLRVSLHPLVATQALSSPAIICHGDTATLTVSGLSTHVWSTSSAAASIRVTPTSTTPYTVTGMDSNTCRHIDTVTVTVRAVPTVSATATPTTLCAGDTTVIAGTGLSNYVWSPGSNTSASFHAVPMGTTTYTLTGTDANGCKGGGTVTVTVHTAPTVTATASPNSLCAGDTTLITGTGLSNYTWSPVSNTTASFHAVPTGTTTYTLTGTDANGCKGSGMVTVTVNTPPTTPSIQHTSGTLSTTAAATHYQWYHNGAAISGATSASYSTTISGSYTVEITNANGCTATSAPFVISGINTIGMSHISVYPNPSNGLLHITTESDAVYQVTVTDMSGRELLLSTISHKDEVLDISSLANGTYILQIKGGEVSVATKITKE